MNKEEQKNVVKPAPTRGAKDPVRRSEIARMGGLALSKDHAHMVALGKKGGAALRERCTDPEYFAKLGKKGGLVSAAVPGRMAELGRKGGLARKKAKTENSGG